MATPNKIVVDLTDCNYIYDFHQRIMKAFDFPSLYGVGMHFDILYGISSLPATLKTQAQEITGIL